MGLLLFVPTIQDHAVCVRHWDWSETSQTVSLMTREHGLIRCLAKGSKREKSAFSGGLEIATMGHMVAIVKPTTDLAILTAWDLTEPMYAIRQSLTVYHASMFVIDLIPRMIHDHDPHPEVFDALVQSLLRFGSSADPISQASIYAQTAWYLWALLDSIGSKPELMVDVNSGDALEEDAPVYGFHPSLGGLTLDPKSMAQDSPSAVLSDAWRVRRSTVHLLRNLRDGESANDLGNVPVDQLVRLCRLLGAYCRTIIGTEIPSGDWLLSGDDQDR